MIILNDNISNVEIVLSEKRIIKNSEGKLVFTINKEKMSKSLKNFSLFQFGYFIFTFSAHSTF